MRFFKRKKESVWEDVPCPDGTTRKILKNPEEAFSIFFPNWDVQIETSFRSIAAIKFEGEKRKETMVKDLTEKYAKLKAHYLSAYVTFCNNACDKEAYNDLNKANEEIRKHDFQLTEMEKSIQNQLDGQLKREGMPTEELDEKEKDKAKKLEQQTINDLGQFIKVLNDLADPYKKLRETKPYGPERTQKMTSAFLDMRGSLKVIAKLESFSRIIQSYFYSGKEKEVDQLIAVALVDASDYDVKYFDELLKIIDGGSGSAFVQYEAMAAVLKMVPNLTNSQKDRLREALKRQRDFDPSKNQWIKKPGDRWNLSEDLLSAMS